MDLTINKGLDAQELFQVLKENLQKNIAHDLRIV